MMSTVLVMMAVCGCSPGFDSGAGEPFRVRQGTFFPGAFPEDDQVDEPKVTNASTAGAIVTEGQSSVPLTGLTTTDAWSVALALEGVGSGYWTLPVLAPDVTEGGQLTFVTDLEFTRDVPFGFQKVLVSALDEAGLPGPRFEVSLCVLPETTGTSLWPCAPDIRPQHTVISLAWDTDVDLDLIVTAPNGKVVRAKTPSTPVSETGPIPNPVIADPTTGLLSRDSNGGCVLDRIRRESLVFQDAPPPGEYTLFASLNATCGQSHVVFRASHYTRRELADGRWAVDEVEIARGQLLPVHADGGATLGTRIGTVTIP